VAHTPIGTNAEIAAQQAEQAQLTATTTGELKGLLR
jgi:hypothetical protein